MSHSCFDDGLADELNEARDRAAAEAEAARVAALEARLAAVTEAARTLVDALPKCDRKRCAGVATKIAQWDRRTGIEPDVDGIERCDRHDDDDGLPAVGYAPALRALAALLGEKENSR